MKILELKQNIFKENEVTADKIRDELKKQKKLMINVMSSPGSGKTTTLLRTIERLQGITRIGVMECDIDASVDAVMIENGGAKAIQLHTGGMCHMDAAMTQQGLNEMGMDDVDLIFIENVGNLVVLQNLIPVQVLILRFYQFLKGMINQLSIHWFILLVMLF